MRKSLSVIAGVVCALVIWSAFVAVALWRPTGYSYDAQMGRVYRPGLYLHGTEGYSVSRINSLGMRNPELAEKTAGERRILFLGDSLTEAFQVPESRTFAVLSATMVGSRTGKTVPVNAGRSGGSPAAYIVLAPWYRERVEPDAVVVQVSDQDFASDIENTSRNFYLRRAGGGFETVFNPDYRTANPLLQRLPFLAPILDVPVLRLASQNVWKVLAMPSGSRPFFGAAAPASAASAAAPSTSATAPPASQADAALIDWVVSELAAAYPRLVILYLPEGDYLKATPGHTPVAQALEAAARREGVELVDVTGPFADMFESARVAPTGFANSRIGSGHLNASGHRAVAEELTPALERVLSP